MIVQFLGGIETTRLIHHIAAAIFLLEAVYHLIMVGYKIFVQNKEASMLPGIKDGTGCAAVVPLQPGNG